MSSGPSANHMHDLCMERLTRAVGPVAGPAMAREVLTALGIVEVSSPVQLLEFAEGLIRKGGIFDAVGRGLKVSALLRGAKAA